MGVVKYYMLGEYEPAQKLLKEALVAYQDAGNSQGQSSVLNNMGENARLQGNYSLAAGYYENALVIARQIGAHNKANVFLSNLCGVYINVGKVNLPFKISKTWYSKQATIGMASPKLIDFWQRDICSLILLPRRYPQPRMPWHWHPKTAYSKPDVPGGSWV